MRRKPKVASLVPFLVLVPFMSASATGQEAPPSSLIGEEVCFTPDESCDAKLVEFIKSAKQSIDMAIYDLNLDQLAHQLIVSAKKIHVRIVADRRQSKGSHSLIPLLIKGGVSVRFGHQRGIMHNKFTVVDGVHVETGSFNYTNHASRANQENQIYLTSPQIVRRYAERFEKIWSDARDTGLARSHP